VTGKLTKGDYESFAPVVNEQIEEHRKVCILFEMHDFHGWSARALWEDTKFDFKHWKDIERGWPSSANRNGKRVWPSFANRLRLPKSNTSTLLRSMKRKLGSNLSERRQTCAQR
jgi:hypothetical protein